jgi:rSAM/selenodomain-associated transferase 1
VQICIIAKEPRPGFAKTRLTPPCTPTEAAGIAEASLADTLEVVRRTPARRRVVALDGAIGPWLPSGFDVVPQPQGGLDRRLESAFAHCFRVAPSEPVVLIGMDTPQVQPDDLLAAGRLLDTGTDAVLGLATDGGYWLIGLRRPVIGAFTGIPMSTAHTGAAQLTRLARRGCSIETVATLDDVDDFPTAERVAQCHPDGRFAEAVRAGAGAHAFS